ncbi:exported hypothetical protein [Microbacterium sp. 8M]|nr:exported hypothetical protein [Microbacterium sp. 8M]
MSAHSAASAGLLPGAGIVAMALSSRAAMTAASPLFGPLRAELGFTTAMTWATAPQRRSCSRPWASSSGCSSRCADRTSSPPERSFSSRSPSRSDPPLRRAACSWRRRSRHSPGWAP